MFKKKEKGPSIRIVIERGEASQKEYGFTDSFLVGRGESCDVRFQSGVVSREHARITLEGETWWLEDLGSSNGTMVDGRPIQRTALSDGIVVMFGDNGPLVRFVLGETAAPPPRKTRDHEHKPQTPVEVTRPAHPRGTETFNYDKAPDAPDPSVSQFIRHYFEDSDQPAGEHTQFIRQAYSQVKKKQAKRYRLIIAGVVVVLLGVTTFALMQAFSLENRSVNLFYEIKELDARIARLQLRTGESDEAEVSQQLESLRAEREEMEEKYEGYTVELGRRRALDPEEQVIYRVARIFRESDSEEIPADFIRDVQQQIARWSGMRTIEISLDRVIANNHLEYIVRTFQQYNLPPPLIYVALAESGFDSTQVSYVGAAGMWQFMPETARDYGLETRARPGRRDPGDERFDVLKSTRAAAQYLRDIYFQLGNASYLLAMASYNWGEGRIDRRLDQIEADPGGVPRLRADEVIARLNERIGSDARSRSYWQFYKTYNDIMPEETKNYVLRIFSAAVICEDPRLFGFGFDNPLAPYL